RLGAGARHAQRRSTRQGNARKHADRAFEARERRAESQTGAFEQQAAPAGTRPARPASARRAALERVEQLNAAAGSTVDTLESAGRTRCAPRSRFPAYERTALDR